MLDHQLSAARMADERAGAWIVHGIGQIPHQDHLETELCHLPDSEGPVEDTDICVDAHQSDIHDAFLLAEVVDLLTVVADAVKTDYIKGWMLARPWIRACPILEDGIIAGAHSIINREVAFLCGVARATSQNLRGGRSYGCALDSQALRRALVVFHGIAGGVNDHDTQAAGGADHMIHPGRH